MYELVLHGFEKAFLKNPLSSLHFFDNLTSNKKGFALHYVTLSFWTE